MVKQKLQQSIAGEVRFDQASRTIYSVDASIYEMPPLGVVIPKHSQDIIAAVNIAAAYNVPITARGAATGITGGCLGPGIIIDTSKYLRQILEINYDQEYAICQPGVIQDELNQALEHGGYRLGPDTSTGNRATVGGMLGNNSAGGRSLFYGRMVDHILEADMVLSSGEEIHFQQLSAEEIKALLNEKSPESDIYKKILAIRETYREEIKKRFPSIPRRVSGYNLDALFESEGLNLAKLIAGSEGTLGVVTQMKLRISKRPKATGLALLFLNDMIAGMERIDEILSHSPLSAEMIDHQIIKMGRQSPALRGKTKWLEGMPQAIFVIEFQGDSIEEVKEKTEGFRQAMKKKNVGYSQSTLYDSESMNNVWAMRKAGLGLLLSKRTYSRAIAFIEDLSVAPHQLASFMKAFIELLKKHGKEAGIYGHIGSGCIHIRPYVDLRDPEELRTMRAIMLEVTDLLITHNGALSGEHGDGFIRSWLNEKLFGKELYKAFREVKQAFDPLGLMNPHKIVNGEDPLHDLRLSPTVKRHSIETFLDFDKEGGFELSADLCNGNASCRKPEGLMCPPFQASGDEYHTTRARAQMLRGIVNGKLPPETFTSHELYDVMDLCIECKGCKTECPSQVDMAKMKSEFLFHYYKKQGTPLRNYLFANLSEINHFLSKAPHLFNHLSERSLSKQLLSIIGIAPMRTLPPLAAERFSAWIKRAYTPRRSGKQAALFVDTYTEYNVPHIGIAAVSLLDAMGYSLQFIQGVCCGRPMLSKGMLPQAKARAKNILEMMASSIANKIPTIILEPSCLSALIDDYKSLIPEEEERLEALASLCFSFEEFIVKHCSEIDYNFKAEEGESIHFHGHCHQKALHGTAMMHKCLNQVEKVITREIPTGCCGMAGSFGYEKEHYEMSMKIGSLHLFPYIEALSESELLIANGISCRSQILHGTGRNALHIAEYLFMKRP